MAIFSKAPMNPAPDRAENSGLTIVAPGTTILGDLTSEGVVKIEGTIEGTVRVHQQLLIARGGMVRGDVFAAELVVGGEIHGGVQADQRVEIQAGAVINGDIRTQRLLIADGGRVNGQIAMDVNAGEAPELLDSHIR